MDVCVQVVRILWEGERERLRRVEKKGKEGGRTIRLVYLEIRNARLDLY